jgi:hypothetical protein
MVVTKSRSRTFACRGNRRFDAERTFALAHPADGHSGGGVIDDLD